MIRMLTILTMATSRRMICFGPISIKGNRRVSRIGESDADGPRLARERQVERSRVSRSKPAWGTGPSICTKPAWGKGPSFCKCGVERCSHSSARIRLLSNVETRLSVRSTFVRILRNAPEILLHRNSPLLARKCRMALCGGMGSSGIPDVSGGSEGDLCGLFRLE